MTQVAELSIFFPLWNEAGNIKTVITAAITVVKQVAQRWEIIMVDDDSSDDTLQLAKALAQTDQRLVVLSHATNRGYGAALKTSLTAAKYNLVVFNDGDGQFDFREVTKFLKAIAHADIVIGYKKKRLDHPVRHVLMQLLKIWDAVLFRLYLKDIDCGFKLFKKDALHRMMPFVSESAMITTEILAKAKQRQLKITEVEVQHYARQYGDHGEGNLRGIIRALKESVLLWKNLKYQSV